MLCRKVVMDNRKRILCLCGRVCVDEERKRTQCCRQLTGLLQITFSALRFDFCVVPFRCSEHHVSRVSIRLKFRRIGTLHLWRLDRVILTLLERHALTLAKISFVFWPKGCWRRNDLAACKQP